MLVKIYIQVRITYRICRHGGTLCAELIFGVPHISELYFILSQVVKSTAK